MDVDKRSEYYTYRKIIKLMLLISGLYPLENASRFYYVLPYVHLLVNAIIILGIVGFIRLHITNILLLTKRLGILLSYTTVILKIVFMMIYREDTTDLLKTLDVYFNNLINDRLYTYIVLKDISSFRRLSWTMSSLIFSGCVAACITPIILIIHQNRSHVYPVKYILPNFSIYPWVIQPGGYVYVLHYILEMLGCLSLFTITSGVDTLYTLYVIQMIGRLRELSDRMIHLNSFQGDQSDRTICECIYQYEVVLKCRNKVQEIFGPLILWMVVTNAVILCVGIFQLSQMTSMSMIQAILFATVVIAKTVQTFICGWTGTRLTAEDEGYRAAIYATNWQGNKRLMTSVIIMLSQKPLTLTACHFSAITVDIFVSVLNTTISYYFLLQTLQYGK